MVVAGRVKQSKTLHIYYVGLCRALSVILFAAQQGFCNSVKDCSAVIVFYFRRVTKMSIRGIKYYESQKHAPIFYNLSNASKRAGASPAMQTEAWVAFGK